MKTLYRLSRSALTLLALGAAFFGCRVHAGEANIGPVYIDMVAVVQVTAGGHLAGNLEIKIKGGFAPPSNVACDGQYITTLRSTDPDQRLFTLLTIAQMKGKAVRLRITDDPALRAFDGRCSLIWIAIDT